MLCLQCNTETTNPKFCSKSCAAKYNNSISPKRRKVTEVCKYCGIKTPRRDYHFCNKTCKESFRLSSLTKSFESKGIIPTENGYVNTQQVKTFLTQKFGHKCHICNISDWQGKPLLMVLDHVDGNSENWSLANLRLICSNCDSQLPTYKARNTGNGRHSRRKRYKDGLSY